MDEIIHNKKELLERRRELRNSLTPAEAFLWEHLQKSQLDGRKFRRQHSIGYYIVDFYCPSEKLIVELDGAYHNAHPQAMYDEERTVYLESLGLKVIRFENKTVFEHLEYVLEKIKACFKN